jgi:hydroxymethylglutaryl-CoA lyase
MFEGNGKRILLQEVVARDGFQIEPAFIPTAAKIALLNRLSRIGFAKVEVTAFASPKAIPALQDAEAVMKGVQRVSGVCYVGHVPNVRGAERALASGVDEVNLVMSVSETHNLANLRMTREQSFAQLGEVVERVGPSGVGVNASLSTVFGCPMEGRIPDAEVWKWVARVAALGVPGITLCDTTGMADPAQVARMVQEFRTRWPTTTLTLHMHNTRGMGLANILAALGVGADRFDTSLGGLGGCPYAPGATGNVCSEDLAHMLEVLGYKTGIDLRGLLECAKSLPQIVGHEVPGQVAKAGTITDLHPEPDWLREVRARAQARG